jgi:hypothetical protein
MPWKKEIIVAQGVARPLKLKVISEQLNVPNAGARLHLTIIIVVAVAPRSGWMK